LLVPITSTLFYQASRQLPVVAGRSDICVCPYKLHSNLPRVGQDISPAPTTGAYRKSALAINVVISNDPITVNYRYPLPVRKRDEGPRGIAKGQNAS
jgi:hypothetical protein